MSPLLSRALAASLLALWLSAACGQSPTSHQAHTMKIRLILDGQSLSAQLDDTAASRDFYAQLPLRLSLEDYAATEKIAYPPRKLSTAGAPDGYTPAAGDIAYYAPWGNLALFHKGFRYSSGLVRLGRIEGSLERLAAPGKLNVSIEALSP